MKKRRVDIKWCEWMSKSMIESIMNAWQRNINFVQHDSFLYQIVIVLVKRLSWQNLSFLAIKCPVQRLDLGISHLKLNSHLLKLSEPLCVNFLQFGVHLLRNLHKTLNRLIPLLNQLMQPPDNLHFTRWESLAQLTVQSGVEHVR